MLQSVELALVKRPGLLPPPPRLHLASRQETDRFAHLDKRSKEHHANSTRLFDLHSPKAPCRCFRKQHGHVVCVHYNCTWTTRRPVEGGMSVHGRWLAELICQPEGGERSVGWMRAKRSAAGDCHAFNYQILLLILDFQYKETKSGKRRGGGGACQKLGQFDRLRVG